MKLSRQLLIIHSVIIFLLVLGYAWLSLLNIRQLTLQEMVNQSNTSAQYLTEPIRQAVIAKDATYYKTKIDVFYDAGNYARISLYSADDGNRLLYQRDDLQLSAGVPDWFVKIIPLNPMVGYQQIYDGIEPVALLEVQTHPFAFYRFVWRQFLDMTSVTLFVGLVAWILGMALINIVLQPVISVRRQAAAVANRHYPQISTQSGIAEFEQLIQSHNEMTKQLKVLFTENQERMTQLKHDLYHDSASGLPNRTYFNLTLTDLLSRTQKRVPGGLVIIHLANATQIKHDKGFAAYKGILDFVVKSAEHISPVDKNTQLFQLNEQDIGVLMLQQGTTELVDFSKRMVRQLEDCEDLQEYQGAFLGVTELVEGDTQLDVMKRADTALKYAMANDKRFFMDKISGHAAHTLLFQSKEDMLLGLEEARVEFYKQAVVAPQERNHLFTELYTKLSIDGDELSLSEVLTLAEKYDLTSVLDKKVLAELQKHYLIGALQGPISINVSAFSFHSTEFQSWLLAMLEATPELAKSLIMEFDEIDLSHCVQAREWSFKLANLGVSIAIDHFGRGSSSLTRISDMKLHWLKIDSRYIHEDTSNTNQDYLKMICELVEKLGVKAIIPNVETAEQEALAKAVGCSGVQGFLIAKPASMYEEI